MIKTLKELSPEELKEIIEFAKELREKGISYNQVAKFILHKFKVKVSKATVLRWCKGLHNPFSKIKLIEIKESPELSYVTGAFIGDGTLKFDEKYYKYWIILRVKDRDFAEEFKKCLEALGLNPSLRIDRDETRCDRYSVEVSNKQLFMFLKRDIKELIEVGLKYPKEFLQGIFDAEVDVIVSAGKIFSVRASLTNSSLYLLQKIQETLLKFGIHSVIRLHTPKGTWYKSRGKWYKTNVDCYELVIYRIADLRRFAERIGFRIKRKQEKLLDALEVIRRFGRFSKAVKAWRRLYKKINGRWVKVEGNKT